METIVKFNHAQMRADISKIADEQIFLKNQRKEVHIVGERKMSAKDAACKHQTNREDLRIMYAAFGLSRGKSFSVTENHYPEENHPLQKYQATIDRISLKYKTTVKVPSEI